MHTAVDAPKGVFVFCSDADAQDNELTYSLTAGPDHGTLGPLASGEVEYTPADGFSGEDTFTVRGSDGTLFDEYVQRIHVADTPLCSTPPPVQVRPGAGRDANL